MAPESLNRAAGLAVCNYNTPVPRPENHVPVSRPLHGPGSHTGLAEVTQQPATHYIPQLGRVSLGTRQGSRSIHREGADIDFLSLDVQPLQRGHKNIVA